MEKTKKKKWKRVLKWILILIAVFIAYCAGLSVPQQKALDKALLESKQQSDEEYQKIQEKIQNGQQTLDAINEYNSNKKKYDAELTGLQQKIDDKNKELSEADNTLKNEQAKIDAEIAKKQDELNSKTKEFDAEIVKKQDELNNKTKEFDGKIAEKQDELNKKQAEVDSKQAELDKLSGEVVKAAGNPITVSAGDYIVGTDIKAGRYKVSGSSNFVVYTSSGELYINTILGDGTVGRGDYTATLSNKMIVRCSAKTVFTPVKSNK